MPVREKMDMTAHKASLACFALCTAFAGVSWGQISPKTSTANPPAKTKKKSVPRKVPPCEIKASRSKVPAGGKVTLRAIHPKPKGTTFTYGWSVSDGRINSGQATPTIALDTHIPPGGSITATVEINASTDAPFGPDRHRTCSYTLKVVKPRKAATKPKAQAGKQ